MRPASLLTTAFKGFVAASALAAVACGASATSPAVAPTSAKPPSATASSTVAPGPTAITSARNNITLVVSLEPTHVNPFLTSSGQTSNTIYKENLVDPLTWQSGSDQEIVPTSATTGWKQLAPDQWRFTLRQGVKFHNGEPWNAQAALPSLQFQGTASTATLSQPYTGNFAARAVDDYTIDITCEQGCPIFPNTAIYLDFVAPNFLATATQSEQSRTTAGLGPYKMVKWDAGVSITQEAYDGYAPAGRHFELQKPLIRNVKWLWRGETSVMAAMVKVGEADIAWDAGVDAAQALPKGMVRTGNTAKVNTLEANTMWNPELKKVEVRQAMAHAINCQEMIDTLYAGMTKCRGNIIFPGVVGATPENTAPYTYDPERSKQLLKKANYDPNTEFIYMSRATRIPKQNEINEALQAYLKNVGIKMTVRTVDPQIRDQNRKCQAGAAVNDILKASGRVPGKDKPTFDDFRAAVASGGASCPHVDFIENQPPSPTMDFGRLITSTLNCEAPTSPNCDPSPGGFQEMMPKALAASGAERQRLMQAVADRVHDEAWFIVGFDLVYFYAVNPKLNWTPRSDGRVRVSPMWFSP